MGDHFVTLNQDCGWELKSLVFGEITIPTLLLHPSLPLATLISKTKQPTHRSATRAGIQYGTASILKDMLTVFNYQHDATV
jgi:hypothetical protein